MPLIKPPPPTGIINTSMSGCAVTNSTPQVALPSVMWRPSNGCIIVLSSSVLKVSIAEKACAISLHNIISAPKAWHPFILIGSVAFGIAILAETPAFLAAQATANA